MRSPISVALNPRQYLGEEARLFYRYRLTHRLAPWTLVDDMAFLRLKYFQKFGRRLKLRDPSTFNEKLNWMKLYDRNPLYTQLADKYRVREYVEQKVGSHVLNELHGVYESPEEIDWAELPGKFVLKVNQGCKANVICRDRARLDTAMVSEKLRVWLDDNGYFPRREWPYRDIAPRIICEEYLAGDPDWGLLDYKFFCFGGQPRFVAVDFDRFGRHTQFFYDMTWHRQPFQHGLPEPPADAPRPEVLEEMIEVAASLSNGLPFVRVDLYAAGDGVRFGEMTFHPAGSLKPITPAHYDRLLGDLIDLPDVPLTARFKNAVSSLRRLVQPPDTA